MMAPRWKPVGCIILGVMASTIIGLASISFALNYIPEYDDIIIDNSVWVGWLFITVVGEILPFILGVKYYKRYNEELEQSEVGANEN